jgi:CheY-like chemotaxis protein
MRTGLVIEDNEHNRENLVEILEVLGYKALSTSNGLDGIEAAKKIRPDFILCDVLMPDVSGYTVVFELQNDSSTREIPIIFATSLAEEKEIKQGMELGVFGYITKPYDFELLKSTIASCLQPGVPQALMFSLVAGIQSWVVPFIFADQGA